MLSLVIVVFNFDLQLIIVSVDLVMMVLGVGVNAVLEMRGLQSALDGGSRFIQILKRGKRRKYASVTI